MDPYEQYIAQLNQLHHNGPDVVFQVPHNYETPLGRLNIVGFLLNIVLALWTLFTGKPKTGLVVWLVIEGVRSFLAFEINAAQLVIFGAAELVALLAWIRRTYILVRR